MPHVVMTGIAARRFTGGLSEFDVEANTVRRMITELERPAGARRHRADRERRFRYVLPSRVARPVVQHISGCAG